MNPIALTRRCAPVFALALASILPACGRGDKATSETTPQVENIRANPDAYVGKKLTIEGAIEAHHGAGMFTLNSQTASWRDEILVIVPRPEEKAPALRNGDQVRVSGTVKKMVVADIEREYDIDLQPEIEVEFREKPILVADSVQIRSEG
jgi:hypothetical protein